MAEVCTATDTVLVLSSLKTYNIFFECFVGSTSSGPFQTMFSRLISCQLVPPTCDVFIFLKDRLVSQARPFPFLQQRQPDPFHFCSSANHILVMSTGSNRHCGTERVWLVRLSQQFISKSISKSRCSPLQRSMN